MLLHAYQIFSCLSVSLCVWVRIYAQMGEEVDQKERDCLVHGRVMVLHCFSKPCFEDRSTQQMHSVYIKLQHPWAHFFFFFFCELITKGMIKRLSKLAFYNFRSITAGLVFSPQICCLFFPLSLLWIWLHIQSLTSIFQLLELRQNLNFLSSQLWEIVSDLMRNMLRKRWQSNQRDLVFFCKHN